VRTFISATVGSSDAPEMRRRHFDASYSVTELSTTRREGLSERLVAWYDKNSRTLPFRQEPSPYAVWVSEVMLQQTRAEVVGPYFNRWMNRFPDVGTLNRASEDEVLNLWQGLGYYSRARRLQAGARYLVEMCNGELPRTPEELLKVPGIGPYSAGAIASIAYGARVPLVDGNVVRVLSRFFALRGDPARAPLKAKLWQLAAEFVPETRPGDFNQALMELGATVCVPRKPSCVVCPWQRDCAALKVGLVDSLPQLPKRAPPTPLTMIVALVVHRGRYAVQKLPATARWWGGLDAFPFSELSEGKVSDSDITAAALSIAGAKRKTAVEIGSPHLHSVTRFRIRLIPCVVPVADRGTLQAGWRWLLPKELTQLALPAPHRRLLRDLGK
jgi:A/G-specific adenine glycosylase